MSTNTRIKEQTSDQKLIDGLNKHQAIVPSVLIAGAPIKTVDVIATLQARLATANAAQSTRATWLNAVKADRDELDRHACGFRVGPAQSARDHAREESRRGSQGQGDTRSASHDGKEAKVDDQRHGAPDRARDAAGCDPAHRADAVNGARDRPRVGKDAAPAVLH